MTRVGTHHILTGFYNSCIRRVIAVHPTCEVPALSARTKQALNMDTHEFDSDGLRVE